ncbi:MAG: carbamoyltransferase HypF [Thermodesulfobacteriota bacterium]
MQTLELLINGQVQGVGFRPFVYRLAREYRLRGYVRNTPGGVEILIQGPAEAVAGFQRDFPERLPPLARIDSAQKRPLPREPMFLDFAIETSTGGEGHRVLIGPETATCPDCLRDILDPDNARFFYPFTNCTNCGPRFTITRFLPYDRAATSMACFPMCPDCQREYEDPFNRRFHAQPNACPICGPRLWYTDSTGREIAEKQEALALAAQDLGRGFILGIKGLGGFHLACRADEDRAVGRLRQRKRRPDKPLAVMVPDLESAEQIAELTPRERDRLCSGQRPILLARKKPDFDLSPEVAPDTESIGVMLPYTPLHHLLLRLYRGRPGPNASAALVMTSGNLSSEPLALGNREALDMLGKIADCFLLHDRDILIRCDDSVLGVNPASGQDVLFRRARGFTPVPIRIRDPGVSVLGLGAQKKTTVCLTEGSRAFVSQHLGDLDNVSTYAYYTRTIAHLEKLLEIRPEVLVRDLHPDFLSTRYAAEQNRLPELPLQHHFAHIYAVLGENRETGPALGLALDGSGLGTDRTVWGGELLLVHPARAEQKRLGHFSPVLLPGGEAAVNQPWRIAQSYLQVLGIRPGASDLPWLATRARAAAVVADMLDKNINTIQTTSCGRLFDAVAALLGLKLEISYEGQAAVCLESIQDRAENRAYPCPVLPSSSGIVLDTLSLFQAVYQDREAGIARELISRRFHNGLIRGLTNWALAASRQTGIRQIALSGGVLQNMTLAAELPRSLESSGLKVLVHRLLPPNDGCISFGQAIYGGLYHALCRN